jgi:photosystem II stability/assembly factor-like uncharacterized protein
MTDEIAIVLESVDGGRTWRRQAGAPGIVYLNAISCPSVTTCFAVGDTVTDEGASSDAVFATGDGGRRWHEEAVPAKQFGGVLLSAISCPSISRCWAGGGTGVMATTNGGASWQALAPGWIDDLSCASMRRCVVLGMNAGSGEELEGAGLRYRSVDVSELPFLPSSSEMACPSAKVCVAAGSVAGSPSRGAVFVSEDGGRSWSQRPLPSLVATAGGFQAPDTYYPWPQQVGVGAGYTALACPTAMDCLVLGSGAVTEVITGGPASPSL